MQRKECSGTRVQLVLWIPFSAWRNLCQTWGEGTLRIKGQDHRNLWSTLKLQGNMILEVGCCWTPPPRTEKQERRSDHIELEGTAWTSSRAEAKREAWWGKQYQGGEFVYGAVRVGGRNGALEGTAKRRGPASGAREIPLGSIRGGLQFL